MNIEELKEALAERPGEFSIEQRKAVIAIVEANSSGKYRVQKVVKIKKQGKDEGRIGWVEGELPNNTIRVRFGVDVPPVAFFEEDITEVSL